MWKKSFPSSHVLPEDDVPEAMDGMLRHSLAMKWRENCCSERNFTEVVLFGIVTRKLFVLWCWKTHLKARDGSFYDQLEMRSGIMTNCEFFGNKFAFSDCLKSFWKALERLHSHEFDHNSSEVAFNLVHQQKAFTSWPLQLIDQSEIWHAEDNS